VAYISPLSSLGFYPAILPSKTQGIYWDDKIKDRGGSTRRNVNVRYFDKDGKLVQKQVKRIVHNEFILYPPTYTDRNGVKIKQHSGWNNTATQTAEIHRLQEFLIEQRSGEQCVILLDNLTSHLSNDRLPDIDPNIIKIVLMAPNMTPYVQPCDTLFFGALKNQYRSILNEKKMIAALTHYDELANKLISDTVFQAKISQETGVKLFVNLIICASQDMINKSWYLAGLLNGPHAYANEDGKDISGTELIFRFKEEQVDRFLSLDQELELALADAEAAGPSDLVRSPKSNYDGQGSQENDCGNDFDLPDDVDLDFDLSEFNGFRDFDESETEKVRDPQGVVQDAQRLLTWLGEDTVLMRHFGEDPHSFLAAINLIDLPTVVAGAVNDLNRKIDILSINSQLPATPRPATPSPAKPLTAEMLVLSNGETFQQTNQNRNNKKRRKKKPGKISLEWERLVKSTLSQNTPVMSQSSSSTSSPVRPVKSRKKKKKKKPAEEQSHPSNENQDDQTRRSSRNAPKPIRYRDN